MKRVFVVNPPDPDYLSNRVTKDMAGGYGYETGDVVMLPPLDLIYHFLILKKTYDTHFYDLQAFPDKYNLFFQHAIENKNNLFIILVSVLTLNSDIKLVQKLKNNNPHSRIYVKISYNNKEAIKSILNTSAVEKVLFGETELIINKIFENKTSDGCAWLEKGKIVFGNPIVIDNLDDLPDMDLSGIDITGYKYILMRNYKKLFTSFQSSRGCPFSCSYYCPYPMIQGSKWRAMTVSKLFKNVKDLVNIHNVKYIAFRDATFTLDKKRIINFCKMVLDNELKFKWWCESRINCLDEKLIQYMSMAGCKGMNLGVETGDEKLMKSYGKAGVDLSQLRNVKLLCDKYKIRIHFLMIAGLPDESKKTLYNSFKIINELKPKSLGVSAITPYPETQLYSDAVKNNWIIKNDISHYNGRSIVMRGEYISARQIELGVKLLRLTHKYNRRRGWINNVKKAGLYIYFYIWKTLP